MDRAPYPIGGVILASLAGGPLFVFWLSVVSLLVDPTELTGPSPLGVRLIGTLLGLTFFSLPFGLVLALLPNLIGAGVMVRLGDLTPAARPMAAWVLAGALLGAAIAAAFTGFSLQPVAAFLGIGGCSAAICRRFTEWDAGGD